MRPPFPPYCLHRFHIIHLLLPIYRFCSILGAPRAGSAEDGAEIKNERENSIICVVQETTFPGASGDPRTKLRFVFMRYKTLGCSLPFKLIISSI